MIGDVYLKIQRTFKQFDEYHLAVQEFNESQPHKITQGRDDETGDRVYYLTEAKDPPPVFALIAGEIIQNLRCSLDYLAWKLVEVNGNKPGRVNSFPILHHEATNEDEQKVFDAKVKGMSDEAIEVIKSLKPYKGGDNILWALHQLNNVDKHRMLFTVLMGLSSFRRDSKGDWFHSQERLVPVHEGGEIMRHPEDGIIDKRVDFLLQIAINETGIVECQPLISLLRLFQQHVFRVVNEFNRFF
jgi:hypothetical protein